MTIKKELLKSLSEIKLKELAEYKGINLQLNPTKSRYYENWGEKDILIDLLGDTKELTVSEIEKFILANKT